MIKSTKSRSHIVKMLKKMPRNNVTEYYFDSIDKRDVTASSVKYGEFSVTVLPSCSW